MLTFTVRYRLAGATTWEFLDAYSRLDARRRLLRLVPKAHILSTTES